MLEFEVLGVSVRPLVILAAIIVNVVIGMLWYGPVLGKQWLKLTGKKEADLKMKTTDMIFALVLAFFMATGLNSIVQFSEQVSQLPDLVNAFAVTFMVATTITLPALANEVIWEGRNKYLLLLNFSHQFVTILGMSLVLILL